MNEEINKILDQVVNFDDSPIGYDEFRYDLVPSAVMGAALDQYDLAQLFYNGSLLPQDMVQAYSWYEKSARQGFPNAIYMLALMNSKGQGVPVNMNMAISYYEEAAYLGNVNAQFNLGMALYKQNRLMDAALWFALAAKAGDQEAAQCELVVSQNFTVEESLMLRDKFQSLQERLEDTKERSKWDLERLNSMSA